MATVAENLQTILDIKSDIKDAIVAKGVSVADSDSFGSYADKIGEISGGHTSIDVGALGLKFAYSSFEQVPDIFSFDNISDMRWMFGFCEELTSVPLFDTSKVEDFSNAFRSTKLTTIPLFDTSNVINMEYLFYYNTTIESIPQLDAGNCKTISNAFYNCKNLTNVGGFNNFGKYESTATYQNDKSLWFPSSDKLTYESCMNIFYNVYDMTSFDYRKTASIKLHSTPYSLLTDDDIAIATNKGWIVESA